MRHLICSRATPDLFPSIEIFRGKKVCVQSSGTEFLFVLCGTTFLFVLPWDQSTWRFVLLSWKQSKMRHLICSRVSKSSAERKFAFSLRELSSYLFFAEPRSCLFFRGIRVLGASFFCLGNRDVGWLLVDFLLLKHFAIRRHKCSGPS